MNKITKGNLFVVTGGDSEVNTYRVDGLFKALTDLDPIVLEESFYSDILNQECNGERFIKWLEANKYIERVAVNELYLRNSYKLAVNVFEEAFYV